MLKQMLLGLGAATLLVVVTAMPVQAAPILPPELQELIVTRGGWDWVWVSPCVENSKGEGCSFIDGVQAYGFGPPTSTTQWTDSFGPVTGPGYLNVQIAFTGPPSGPAGNCAYKFFSNEYDPDEGCHTGDLGKGAILGSPYPAIEEGTNLDLTKSPVAEELWVKAYEGQPPPNGSLPEPSSLLLLGAGLLGLAAWRWKHAA
jgi:hypothetical protein